ncbi:hypothetical protein [Fimbriiglobus ruber]|uniref:hypothetical protein n=1 Tax=Fimbriiglobus ruber TaxID=1908690 RepID=UPI00117B9DBC|nr:hypothetical protein [Fimbriiglobus ruber]
MAEQGTKPNSLVDGSPESVPPSQQIFPHGVAVINEIPVLSQPPRQSFDRFQSHFGRMPNQQLPLKVVVEPEGRDLWKARGAAELFQRGEGPGDRKAVSERVFRQLFARSGMRNTYRCEPNKPTAESRTTINQTAATVGVVYAHRGGFSWPSGTAYKPTVTMVAAEITSREIVHSRRNILPRKGGSSATGRGGFAAARSSPTQCTRPTTC